jgi:glycosyltransferase involved in cell wall biosynthesis
MKKKILLKGPLLTRSGYGEQTRFALRALRSRSEIFDVYIQPLNWGVTSWLIEDNEERRWIDQAIEKTIGFIQQGGQFDISLQVTIPNEWEQLAPINIGYTAGIEATRVTPHWLEKTKIMDKIITISNFSKSAFEQTNYQGTDEKTGQQVVLSNTTPIVSVNYPVKTYANLPELDLNLKYDFNFLIVAQFGIRKNLENTIKWFVQEFKDDEVGLVVKTNLAKNCLMDREVVLDRIKHLTGTVSDAKCKVYLLHGDMTDEEVHSLYCHPKLKAMVSLPHGEGFGLPMFEAAYSGMPVVATGWSGQLDYLVDENQKEQFYNVSYDIQPIQDKAVWEGVLAKEAMWSYPRESSAKTQMRRCYEDVVENRGQASKSCAYAQELQERFSEEKMLCSFADEVHKPDPEISEWLSKLEALEEL